MGIQILVASGHLKEYSRAFTVGIAALIIINISIGLAGNIYGIALAAVLAELTLTFAIVYQIKKINYDLKKSPKAASNNLDKQKNELKAAASD